MKCEFCGSIKSGVTNSRKYLNYCRRRRHCQSCGKSFTTFEFTQPLHGRLELIIEHQGKNAPITVVLSVEHRRKLLAQEVIDTKIEKFL